MKINQSTKKQINVMATSVLAATILLTPLTSVLPVQNNVVHAEETKVNDKKSQDLTQAEVKLEFLQWIDSPGGDLPTILNGDTITVNENYGDKGGLSLGTVNVDFSKLSITSSDEQVIPSVLGKEASKREIKNAKKGFLELHPKKVGTSEITIKDASGKVLITFKVVVTQKVVNELAEKAEQERLVQEQKVKLEFLQWIGSPGGDLPTILNGDTITVNENYGDKGGLSLGTVNVDFSKLSIISSDEQVIPSVLGREASKREIKNAKKGFLELHPKKVGTSEITIKDASGKVLITFKVVVTQKAVNELAEKAE